MYLLQEIIECVFIEIVILSKYLLSLKTHGTKYT